MIIECQLHLMVASCSPALSFQSDVYIFTCTHTHTHTHIYIYTFKRTPTQARQLLSKLHHRITMTDTEAAFRPTETNELLSLLLHTTVNSFFEPGHGILTVDKAFQASDVLKV